MSYLKAKMHQIRFYSAPPDYLTGFEGVLLLREGNGKREGKGKGRGEVAS